MEDKSIDSLGSVTRIKEKMDSALKVVKSAVRRPASYVILASIAIYVVANCSNPIS